MPNVSDEYRTVHGDSGESFTREDPIRAKRLRYVKIAVFEALVAGFFLYKAVVANTYGDEDLVLLFSFSIPAVCLIGAASDRLRKGRLRFGWVFFLAPFLISGSFHAWAAWDDGCFTAEERVERALRADRSERLERILDRVEPDEEFLSEQFALAVMRYDCIDCLEILVDAGADPGGSDEDGRRPLIAYAEKGAQREALVALGAPDIAFYENYRTDLHLAALEGRAEDLSRFLAEDVVPVDLRDASGYSALLLAAASNRLDCASALIRAGAEIDAATARGQTPLMFACLEGVDPEMTELLLENGADIEALSEYRESPLSVAVENSNAGTLRVLMEHGVAADPERIDEILEAAEEPPSGEILAMLRDYSAE